MVFLLYVGPDRRAFACTGDSVRSWEMLPQHDECATSMPLAFARRYAAWCATAARVHGAARAHALRALPLIRMALGKRAGSDPPNPPTSQDECRKGRRNRTI